MAEAVAVGVVSAVGVAVAVDSGTVVAVAVGVAVDCGVAVDVAVNCGVAVAVAGSVLVGVAATVVLVGVVVGTVPVGVAVVTGVDSSSPWCDLSLPMSDWAKKVTTTLWRMSSSVLAKWATQETNHPWFSLRSPSGDGISSRCHHSPVLGVAVAATVGTAVAVAGTVVAVAVGSTVGVAVSGAVVGVAVAGVVVGVAVAGSVVGVDVVGIVVGVAVPIVALGSAVAVTVAFAAMVAVGVGISSAWASNGTKFMMVMPRMTMDALTLLPIYPSSMRVDFLTSARLDERGGWGFVTVTESAA